MTSKELLREFYYHAEQDADNDFKLGIMNSAYWQIAKDLEILDILKKHPDYLEIARRFELTEDANEELKKVKEWLEYDDNKGQN